MTLKTIATLFIAGGMTIAANAQTVNQREVEQQKRIGQGVKSGQLTPKETAHVEHKDAHIAREVHRDRVTNGGHLTPAQHAKVNRQQNRTSGAIARDKHNAAQQ